MNWNVKIGNSHRIKLTRKLLIVNFMKLYPANTVLVSLTMKLPKHIIEQTLAVNCT